MNPYTLLKAANRIAPETYSDEWYAQEAKKGNIEDFTDYQIVHGDKVKIAPRWGEIEAKVEIRRIARDEYGALGKKAVKDVKC